MFEAGFTYILCKTLMNTRTKKNTRKRAFFNEIRSLRLFFTFCVN